MVERATATRIVGCGPDSLPGWYSISLEEVTGLESGASNLQVLIPEGVALWLARQIRTDLQSAEASEDEAPPRRPEP